ncbi:MAG: AAA family ATPase [Candidatus Bathyarchaeota archaeon]
MIEELSLRGFKSYRDRQIITFTRGVNKISGRNAAGKTTILEAVIFGLFGEVPGVDKRELVSLGLDSLYVRVSFRSPLTGQRATVIREGEITLNNRTGERSYRSKSNALQVEDETPVTRATDIQARLKELLGVGRTTFLNVVYAKQKEFIEIVRPRDEKRMDAMLGLTTPSEVREQLRETKKVLQTKGRVDQRPAIEERIRNAEQARKDAAAQAEQLEKQLKELDEGLRQRKSEEAEAHRRLQEAERLQNRLQDLERQSTRLNEVRATRESKEEDLQRLTKSFEDDPAKLQADHETQLHSAQSAEQRLQRLLDTELDQERREHIGAVERLQHQIDEHASLKEQGLTVCPKCGQPINHSLLEEDVENWTRELEEKRSHLKAVEAEISTIREQAQQSRRKAEKTREQLTDLKARIRQAEETRAAIRDLDRQAERLQAGAQDAKEATLREAEEQLGRAFASPIDAAKWLEERIRAQRKEYNALTKTVGDMEGEQRSLSRQRGDCESRLEQQRAVLEDSRAQLSAMEEYEAKIRALEAVQDRYTVYERELRENTVRLLEYRTYEYFQRLTDQQLYSGCHIDRDKYVLEVQPIGSPRLLPAWRAGGGHESLLALAERLALLRVMEFPHLLILDEPTDAVDSENVPQLLDYIARTSEEIGQVILVTHHGYGEEQGVNLITVSKSGKESRVQQGL